MHWEVGRNELNGKIYNHLETHTHTHTHTYICIYMQNMKNNLKTIKR